MCPFRAAPQAVKVRLLRLRQRGEINLRSLRRRPREFSHELREARHEAAVREEKEAALHAHEAIEPRCFSRGVVAEAALGVLAPLAIGGTDPLGAVERLALEVAVAAAEILLLSICFRVRRSGNGQNGVRTGTGVGSEGVCFPKKTISFSGTSIVSGGELRVSAAKRMEATRTNVE